MKSRDTLLRLKRFQVDEKRRKLSQIETMVAEFERMATELDREIASEEARAGIADRTHFAYPTYARAALQKFEILDDREQLKERVAEAVREQSEMDRIGLRMARA